MQQTDQATSNVHETPSVIEEFRRVHRHADSIMTTFDNLTRRILLATREDLLAIQGEAAAYRHSLGFPIAPVPAGMPMAYPETHKPSSFVTTKSVPEAEEWMHVDGRRCVRRESDTVGGWMYEHATFKSQWCSRQHKESKSLGAEGLNWLEWSLSEEDGTWWCPLCGADLHYRTPGVKELHRGSHDHS